MYTQFASRSHEIWRELEGATGRDLLTQNGLLVISGKGPRAANHEEPDFLGTTIDVARQNRIAHEILDGREARARFPAFRLEDDDRTYFEPAGGFVRPEACVSAQLDSARNLGAQIHAGETALSFRASPTNVSVVTDNGTYVAEKLVVTAGPWLPALIGEAYAPLFKVRRQVLYWFRPEGAGAGDAGHFRRSTGRTAG
jgi:sarcosine oxidase